MLCLRATRIAQRSWCDLALFLQREAAKAKPIKLPYHAQIEVRTPYATPLPTPIAQSQTRHDDRRLTANPPTSPAVPLTRSSAHAIPSKAATARSAPKSTPPQSPTLANARPTIASPVSIASPHVVASSPVAALNSEIPKRLPRCGWFQESVPDLSGSNSTALRRVTKSAFAHAHPGRSKTQHTDPTLPVCASRLPMLDRASTVHPKDRAAPG